MVIRGALVEADSVVDLVVLAISRGEYSRLLVLLHLLVDLSELVHHLVRLGHVHQHFS